METVVPSDGAPTAGSEREEKEMDRLLEVGNSDVADGWRGHTEVFRKSSDVLDREDLSPAIIAERKAEEAIFLIVSRNLPSHAMYLTSLMCVFKRKDGQG